MTYGYSNNELRGLSDSELRRAFRSASDDSASEPEHSAGRAHAIGLLDRIRREITRRHIGGPAP